VFTGKVGCRLAGETDWAKFLEAAAFSNFENKMVKFTHGRCSIGIITTSLALLCNQNAVR